MAEYKPDYSTYTVDELIDALNHIDKEKYQERYLEIQSLLNRPGIKEQLDKSQKLAKERKAKKRDDNLFAIILCCIGGFSILFLGIGYTRNEGFVEIDSFGLRICLSALLFLIAAALYE